MNQRLLVWLSRSIVTSVVVSLMWLAHLTAQMPTGGKAMLLAGAPAQADAASAPLR